MATVSRELQCELFSHAAFRVYSEIIKLDLVLSFISLKKISR